MKELTITLTLSDRLFELLEDKLPTLGRRVEKSVTKQLGSIARSELEMKVSAADAAEVEPTDAAEK